MLGLTWSALRYLHVEGAEAYERHVERYGAPDHPLVNYARAVVGRDQAGAERWGCDVVDLLRRRGDHYVADYHEIGAFGKAR